VGVGRRRKSSTSPFQLSLALFDVTWLLHSAPHNDMFFLDKRELNCSLVCRLDFSSKYKIGLMIELMERGNCKKGNLK